eukprot:1114406-Amorphochlora_amoeboformis.AAC.1
MGGNRGEAPNGYIESGVQQTRVITTPRPPMNFEVGGHASYEIRSRRACKLFEFGKSSDIIPIMNTNSQYDAKRLFKYAEPIDDRSAGYHVVKLVGLPRSLAVGAVEGSNLHGAAIDMMTLTEVLDMVSYARSPRQGQ